MSDLIERWAAIEIIQSMYPGMPRIPWVRKDWQKRYEPYIRTENAIRKLPSVQPRMNGKWVKGINENGVTTSLFCSECNYENKHWYEWNYCPNCGADMRRAGWMTP